MTRIWWQECKNQHAQFSECENQSRTVAQNLWIPLAYRLIVFAFYIFLPFWNLSHIPAATNPRSSMLEILVDSLSRWLKRFEDSWFGTLDSASNATFQLDPAMLWASSKALSEGSRMVTYKHERLYIKYHQVPRNVSTPDWPHWSSQQLYLLQFTNCENGRNLWHCDRAFLGAQVRDDGSWTIYGSSHALSNSRFSQKSMIRLENLEVHQFFAQNLSLRSCFVRFVSLCLLQILESLPHSALQPYLVSIVCHWYIMIKVDCILICYQVFKHLVEHNRMVLIGFRCKSSMAEEQGPVSQISSQAPYMQSPMKRSFGRTCRPDSHLPFVTRNRFWGQFHCCGTHSQTMSMSKQMCEMQHSASPIVQNMILYQHHPQCAIVIVLVHLVPVVSQLELAADSLPQRPARGRNVPGGGQSTPMGT